VKFYSRHSSRDSIYTDKYSVYALDAAAVSVMTKLGDRRKPFDSQRPYLYRLDRLWGPILFLLRVCQKISPTGNRQWSETDHSPPPNVEIKSKWSYSYTSRSAFKMWCFCEHKDKFYFAV